MPTFYCFINHDINNRRYLVAWDSPCEMTSNIGTIEMDEETLAQLKKDGLYRWASRDLNDTLHEFSYWLSE
jgi:hypothetical protein